MNRRQVLTNAVTGIGAMAFAGLNSDKIVACDNAKNEKKKDAATLTIDLCLMYPIMFHGSYTSYFAGVTDEMPTPTCSSYRSYDTVNGYMPLGCFQSCVQTYKAKLAAKGREGLLPDDHEDGNPDKYDNPGLEAPADPNSHGYSNNKVLRYVEHDVKITHPNTNKDIYVKLARVQVKTPNGGTLFLHIGHEVTSIDVTNNAASFGAVAGTEPHPEYSAQDPNPRRKWVLFVKTQAHPTHRFRVLTANTDA